MIFKELHLTNFQSYSEAVIKFSGEKITFITGINKETNSSNGVGKSSIKEAILFALFGRSKVKGPDLIRRGAKSVKVKLVVERNGNVFEITRSRKSTTSSLDVVVNNEAIVGTQEQIQKQLEAYLSTSLESFITYSVVDKVRETELAKLSSTDLRVVLQDLIGVTRIQNVMDSLNTHKNDLERYLAKAHTRFFPSEQRLQTLAMGKELFEKLQANQAGNLIDLSSKVSYTTATIAQLRRKIEDLNRQQGNIASIDKCTLCGAPINLDTRLGQLNTIADEVIAATAEIEKLLVEQAEIQPKLAIVKQENDKNNKRLMKCAMRLAQLQETMKDQRNLEAIKQELDLYVGAIASLQAFITNTLTSLATQIEDQMNTELARFTNLTCKLNLTKTTGSGVVLPSCSINVFRGPHEFTYEMLSSGEQALVSLVFKLVISDLRGNVPTLFVDEGLDALDETNRGRVLGLFETSSFQQIFIISHREDSEHLKSAQRILIKKEEDISSIL